MVIDDNERLIGTITDGDIRRSLNNKSNMETQLHKIMNNHPITASEYENRLKIFELIRSKDLVAIPVLDNEGRITNLETSRTLTEATKLDNVVFLLAGGFGKRLGSLTSDKPKPLLNVGDKPIIETIINQLIKYNLKNFIISSHFKSEMLVDYFGNGDSLGINIQHIYEKEPLGTAGSLGLIDELPNDKPIIVMNADILTNVNFDSLLRFHKESNVIATICAQEYVHKMPFGKLIIENSRLQSIKEKPREKSFVSAGIYIFNPEALKYITRNTYLDMPDFLSLIMSKNKEIAVFPLHEYWLDIGQIEDYKKGQKDYFEKFSN